MTMPPLSKDKQPPSPVASCGTVVTHTRMQSDPVPTISNLGQRTPQPEGPQSQGRAIQQSHWQQGHSQLAEPRTACLGCTDSRDTRAGTQTASPGTAEQRTPSRARSRPSHMQVQRHSAFPSPPPTCFKPLQHGCSNSCFPNGSIQPVEPPLLRGDAKAPCAARIHRPSRKRCPARPRRQRSAWRCCRHLPVNIKQGRCSQPRRAAAHWLAQPLRYDQPSRAAAH